MTKGMDQEKRRAWEARMERFRERGWTVAKFCEQEKVGVHTFYYWAQRIGASSRAARTIHPVPPATADENLAADPRVLFQFGGGVEVSIPAHSLDAIRCLVQCVQQFTAAAAPSSFHQVLVRDAAREAC